MEKHFESTSETLPMQPASNLCMYSKGLYEASLSLRDFINKNACIMCTVLHHFSNDRNGNTKSSTNLNKLHQFL